MFRVPRFPPPGPSAIAAALSECVARTLPKRCGRLMMSQARSPLLAEPPLTDQELIDHFGALDERRTEWWVALKLTGADATQDNARSVGRKLMLRLHPDKCKVKGPETDRAFSNLKKFTDKIARRPYSLASAHASGIRPAPAQPPRTATAAGGAQADATSAGAAKAGAAKAGAPSSKAARPAERQSSWSEADAKARAAAKPRKAPKAAAASSPSASRPAAAAATAAADAAAKKKSQAAKRKRAEEASARAAA